MAKTSAFKTLLGKARQYPVAIIAFGISFIAVVAILLRASSLANMHDILVTKEEQWVRITNNLKNSKDLEAHVESIVASSDLIQSRLMVPGERALNDQYFYDLRELSGVRIASLNEAGVIETKSAKLPGIEEFKEYVLIDYRITVEGSFNDIVDFATRLVTGRYFARVSAFSVARASDSGEETLHLNLQLQMLGEKDDA